MGHKSPRLRLDVAPDNVLLAHDGCQISKQMPSGLGFRIVEDSLGSGDFEITRTGADVRT